MSKTLSREVIEELQRYKLGPLPPRLRRSDAPSAPSVPNVPKISDRYNSAEISRLVAALILSTQQTLAEESRKSLTTPSDRRIAA